MIQRADAVIYSVTDLARSKEFYGNVLAMQMKVDERNFTAFDCGNLLIGLRARQESVAGPRLPEVVFYVRDLNLAYERIQEHKVVVPSGPVETDWGARKINFDDPDGHPLEIVTYTQVRL